jgi:hypothetical protein
MAGTLPREAVESLNRAYGFDKLTKIKIKIKIKIKTKTKTKTKSCTLLIHAHLVIRSLAGAKVIKTR